MFPSNSFAVYKEFFFSAVAVFAISTMQNIGAITPLWPLAFMILMVVVYSGRYGRVDLTMTNTLARWLVECDQSLNPVDVVYTLLAQFIGALLGSIIYGIVTDAPTEVFAAAIGASDKWRPLLCFIFFHGVYYQVIAAYKKSNNSLEQSIGLAFAYASVAIAFQVFAPGTFGGINLDLGRLFGSKIVHSTASGDNLKETWWLLLLGPIGGVVQAKFFLWLESFLNKDSAAKLGDDNAKGDVEVANTSVPAGADQA